MSPLSRRSFLVLGAAACGCGAVHRPAWAAGGEPLHLPKHDEVSLLEGPLRVQLDHQQSLFLALDNDALLKPFRQRAGQEAPGADMGGWYDDSRDFHAEPTDKDVDFHGFIAGHSFGQYVSGLARGFAGSGDTRVQAKIAALVEGYKPTVSPSFFADYNLPAYTYDKLAIGLIDARHHAGIETAPILARLTDSVLPYLPEKGETREERRKRPYRREAQIWDEPYTLPENLFLASERGFGPRYGEMARRYLQDDALFDPLAEGRNVFSGRHAYSHVNALSSAFQAYLSLGSEKHLKAARNGFSILQAQSYATGGWGPDEQLIGDDGGETLFKSLSKSHSNFETPCGAYGHFKIARHLLRLTGDSRYGDSMERVLYNTVLGAKPTEADGRTFYYSDYNDRGRKDFHRDRWPCCSGTFVQLTADYGISAYLLEPRGISVTLYVPSELRTRLDGQEVRLRQTTDYPAGDLVDFTIESKAPARFALGLRIPAWAGRRTSVTLNGKKLAADLAPGRFARIERVWKPNDKLVLHLDQTIRVEALSPSYPNELALLRGSRVLFATEKLDQSLTRADLLAARPSGPESWLVRGSVPFRPFTAIDEQPYRLYTAVSA
jgi:DUF1680 family protein